MVPSSEMEAGDLEEAWKERMEGRPPNWTQTPPRSQSGSPSGSQQESPQKDSKNGSPLRSSPQAGMLIIGQLSSVRFLSLSPK